MSYRRAAPNQIRENVAALRHFDFTGDELVAIDGYAQEGE
jgi:hypothetical protein